MYGGPFLCLDFKTVLNKHTEVIASAGAVQEMRLCWILDISARQQIVTLCNQLHGISGVSLSKEDEVAEVYIDRDVAVPG